MTLYQYLLKNGVKENLTLELQCARFEMYFSAYMMSGGRSDLNMLVSETLSFMPDDTLQLEALPNSSFTDYPDNYTVLTQSILYCLEKYGSLDTYYCVDEEKESVSDRQKRINDYLAHEKMRPLAEQKSSILIYMLSALVKGKKEANDRKKKHSFMTEDAISETDSGSATNDASLKEEDVSLAMVEKDCQHFLTMLKIDVEDPVRQIALDHVITTLMRFNKTTFCDEQTTVDWLYKKMVEQKGADAWVFLNMVYRRYRVSSRINALECRYTLDTLGSFNQSHAIYPELKKVERTYEEMEVITAYQAKGMRAGGFVLGVTAGAVILEWVAQQEFAEAWHIILLSGALCMTAGDFLGRFFYKSHNEELDKANKQNYFNEMYLKKEAEPLSRTAYWGVNSECFFVFFETIAVGMFFCDLGAWAANSHEDYEMTFMLPGKYFWDNVAMKSDVGMAAFMLATAAVTTLAVFFGLSMRSGHAVLDAAEATKFDHEQGTLATMKTLRWSAPVEQSMMQRVRNCFR